MTPRREYAGALAALASGAVLTLLALQPTWIVAALPPTEGARVPVDLSGGDLVAAVRGLGLLALAGVVGVVATRGRGRVVVGVVLAAAGVTVSALVVAALLRPLSWARSALTGGWGADVAARASMESVAWGWGWLAAGAGTLVAGVGVLTVVHGGRWPVMAGRYDRAARLRSTADDPWVVLDRGEDPTLGPTERATDEGDGAHLPE